MNVGQHIDLAAYGTSEGVSKAWDTRGRKGATVAHPPFSGPTRIGRGDVHPRSEYDEHTNKEVRDMLRSKGFTVSGPNSDPTKPVEYTQHTTFGNTANEEKGFNGNTTHTVMVYPNGEWEHTQESTHGGHGAAAFGALNIEKGPSEWPGTPIAARSKKRRRR